MARLLHIVMHSTEAPDRASLALATALAAQREGHEVGLWLSGEGARLGVQGVAETLAEPLPETAAAMRDALLAGGAVLHVERLSFERRMYEVDALVDGAEVVEAGALAALIADGWQTVTL